MDPFDQMS